MTNSSPFGSSLSLVISVAVLLLCNGCFCQKNSDCSNSSCGTIFANMSYPFGLANSGCGHPAFQIHCVSGKPHLTINGVNYTVLDHKNSTITVVNDGVFSNPLCPFPHGPVNLTASPFMLSPLYNTNLTLFLGCSFLPHGTFLGVGCNVSLWYDWNYTQPPPVLHGDCTVIQVPTRVSQSLVDIIDKVLQGFEILWDETGEMFSKCRDCEKRKGICGFNFTVSGEFVCSVPKNPNSTTNGNSPESAGTANSTFLPPGVHGRDKSYAGMIIGIGSSAVSVVALLLAIACRKKMFDRQVIRRKRINPQSISKVETFLQKYVDQMPNRFSYSSLKKITNNFAHKLGEGGFGAVYKGKLPSGNLVAVKLLEQSSQSESQFINEVATIGRIHHVHLVRLLGYCFEGHTSALVYEYMANGSLDRFILARKEEDKILNWDQLYSVALGAARGIAYLHNECDSRIIHFDIKPHNILLDEEFTAKVADFGLAKLCGRKDDHVSVTTARGTPGYAAPEVWSRNFGPVTDKSDVYGFGMMLLEMVGGRKNIDVQMSHSSQFYFPDWAIKLVERGELRTRLRERELSGADEAKARSLTKVGLWCIQYNSRERPSMMRVLQMLEGDANDIPNPPTPFNARPPLPATEESSSTEIERAS